MSSEKLPKIGNLAPAFTLLNHKGEKVALKDYRGEKRVVLYFYPKAMTPGCTVQAQGLRDVKRKLTSRDTVVLGVSPDEPARLAKFVEKEKLNFDLLSDPDHKISEKYGVWAKKKNYGREYFGVVRTTFVIGDNGKILEIMDKVKTKTHHDDVLEILDDQS